MLYIIIGFRYIVLDLVDKGLLGLKYLLVRSHRMLIAIS
jgi:hypothetical protein